ncbi:endonuclease/exonuclease/phosphatase family protein [Polaribacter sp. Asnod1-A03]|uniref:endonuclease/exonuclease/phosphatase family protein n=1 Tax=Polaribacter sp. Asnod1-A03 TaxID=3160581 RepID=UPI003869029D
MKAVYLFLFSLFICACSSKKRVTSPLKVMTYNIRLDVASDGENAWPNRKDFLTNHILFLAPDVLGVQEAKPNQIEDLNNALTGYKFIGEGRDGLKKGEYSAIYYNSEKVEVIEEHTFWLSKTPTKVSIGWDAACPRICTYGLFSFKNSDKKFWAFNTHLDHVGSIAQKKGLQLILNKIALKNTENYPIILTGDLNVTPDNDILKETKKIMNDTKNVANIRFGADGTFNGFKYNQPVTRRIDYIFISKLNTLKVDKYAVLSSVVDFKFPSDHFPVFAELKLE